MDNDLLKRLFTKENLDLLRREGATASFRQTNAADDISPEAPESIWQMDPSSFPEPVEESADDTTQAYNRFQFDEGILGRLRESAKNQEQAPIPVPERTVSSPPAPRPKPKTVNVPDAPAAMAAVPSENVMSDPSLDPNIEQVSPEMSEEPQESVVPSQDIPKSEDTILALQRAQDAANLNRFTHIMNLAGKQAGGAIAQTKMDTTAATEMLKGSDRPVAAVKDRQTVVSDEQKILKAGMELDNQQAMNDPNSDISKLYGDLLKKQLKINLPEGTTAAQMEKLIPALRSTFANTGGANRFMQGKESVINPQTGETEVRNILIDRQTGEKIIGGVAGMGAKTFIDPETGGRIIYDPASRQKFGGLTGARPEGADFNLKEEKDVKEALKVAQDQEEFKVGKKITTATGKIRQLLKDAGAKGGQSLAGLGPTVAKGIFGEVGALTEGDVTRYVRNPTILGSLQDIYQKYTSGTLSKTSVDNLSRLLDVMEKEGNDNVKTAYQQAARQQSRITGIPEDKIYRAIDPSTQAFSQNSTIKIRRKSDGAIKKVPSSSAARFLQDSDFEEVE